MNAIRLVLFDLGDVVCRFVPQRRLDAFVAATGLVPDVIQQTLWGSGFSGDCDDGRYAALEMVAEINRRLETSLTMSEIQRLWTTAFEPELAVLAIAASVRKRYRTELLSNNSPLLKTALPEWLPAIHQDFDPIIFSCEYGVRKPHAALFNAVRQQLGATADDLLLIDDSPRNVEGAKTVGWRAIQFVTAGELEPKLRDAGLLV